MACIDYIFKTVQYEDDAVNLTASVYLPESNISIKGVALYFHGGGYVVGSRKMLSTAHIVTLNEAGFIAVASDYRLCPTISVLDGPVADSVAAFTWAQEELPRLLETEHNIRVDGKNIVTLGHSCGGGLALLMASRPHPPKAVLDLFGFKYLRDSFYHTAKTPSVHANGPPLPSMDFINKVFEEVPPPTAAAPPFGPNGPDLSNPRKAYLVTSVANGVQFDTIIGEDEYDQVDAEHLFRKPNFPPTFFIQGTADAVVDAKFAQWAHGELQKRGVQTELCLVGGANHGFDARLERDAAAFEPVRSGVEFLSRHVK